MTAMPDGRNKAFVMTGIGLIVLALIIGVVWHVAPAIPLLIAGLGAIIIGLFVIGI